MAKRAEIFARLRAENPAPTTELDFGTPFELLVAVMLSAQATDVSVNQATATLFAEANTASRAARPRPRQAQGPHQVHRPLQYQGRERA